MSGGKKDAIGDMSKPRLSLIPKEALWSMGQAFTYGEKHYGSHNWRLGLGITYLLDGALRHINEFNNGEDIDVKSQNHHLGNAMANLAMAISTFYNNPSLDDRYKVSKKCKVEPPELTSEDFEEYEKEEDFSKCQDPEFAKAFSDYKLKQEKHKTGKTCVSCNIVMDYVTSSDKCLACSHPKYIQNNEFHLTPDLRTFFGQPYVPNGITSIDSQEAENKRALQIKESDDKILGLANALAGYKPCVCNKN